MPKNGRSKNRARRSGGEHCDDASRSFRKERHVARNARQGGVYRHERDGRESRNVLSSGFSYGRRGGTESLSILALAGFKIVLFASDSLVGYAERHEGNGTCEAVVRRTKRRRLVDALCRS